MERELGTIMIEMASMEEVALDVRFHLKSSNLLIFCRETGLAVGKSTQKEVQIGGADGT